MEAADGATRGTLRTAAGELARRVAHAALSDVGRRRAQNEDRFAVLDAGPDGGWGFDVALIVCDGVGGQPDGELASELAVDAFRNVLETRSSRPLRARLEIAARAANASITERADAGGGAPATTAVVLVVNGERVTVAHVGDSRAYRLRAGVLEQLTEDHSFVAEQVRLGLITPVDAFRHPLRGRLSRALGAGQDGSLDIAEHDARSGDAFLVCSDGLHGLVEDGEIAGAVDGDLERSAKALIDLANAAGGRDNVTVALCRVD